MPCMDPRDAFDARDYREARGVLAMIPTAVIQRCHCEPWRDECFDDSGVDREKMRAMALRFGWVPDYRGDLRLGPRVWYFDEKAFLHPVTTCEAKASAMTLGVTLDALLRECSAL